MKKMPQNKGFIRLILIIVAIVFFLGYFNIDIKQTVEKPTTQANIAYVQQTSTTVWSKYLQKPVTYFWDNIFINLLWNSFVLNMERIRDGQPTTLEQKAPIVGV
jgi:hypothetical protein